MKDMRKTWSPQWLGSVQPRKQRKYRANAPLHARHAFLTAPLSKELRQQLRIRHVPVRKGDEVEILRGKFKKTRGDVERVDLRTAKIYVTTAKVKKASGAEITRPIDPSKVRIIKLNLEDKKRRAAVQRAALPVTAQKAAPKAEKPTRAVEATQAKAQATAESTRPEKAPAADATRAGTGGS